MATAGATAVAGLFLVASLASAQETEPPKRPTWEFSAGAMAYLVPDEADFLSPAFKADHDWLHLEARYNYEGKSTASAWIGFRFSAGETLEFEAIPMLGGVFGDTDGIAPGLELSLTYRKFDFYSETEYVFTSSGQDDSFFYAWSELGFSPTDWLRLGLAGQRTRLYQAELELQRGFFVGVSGGHVDFTTCVFNLGWEDPTVVLSLVVSF
jgi:hypothetical protein